MSSSILAGAARLLADRCRSCSHHLAIRSVYNPSGGKRKAKIKTENCENQFDRRLSDAFGTLGADDNRSKQLLAEDLEDDDDNYDVLEIKRGPKMAEIGYQIALTKMIKQKPIQLTKALQTYNQMVSDDRIAPSVPIYTLMITGCAKVGYTEKAFEFFDEMVKYKLKPSKPCITSLFNACAESPFKELGLQKAQYLQEWMRLENVEPNTYNYHSMIKAFGKLGQIQTAFQLVEEMASKGHMFDDYTFSMVMTACISNKESGFFAAIAVIRQFMSKGMPMSINIFNLLLRAVRDCGLGSEQNLHSLLDPVKAPEVRPLNTHNKKPMTKLPPKSELSPKDNSLVTIPNLLLTSFNREIIKVDFKALTKAYNRLMLLGGVKGFVDMMLDFKVTPDIKTVTLLTEIIDFKQEMESEVLDLLDRFKIKADTDLFNILIKRICLQKGLVVAKQMLSQMTARGLQPNIMTFGVLALGCNRYELGAKLLQDMQDLNMAANIEIIGALMTNACKANNVVYINHLLDYIKKNEIRPDQRLVEQLEVVEVLLQKIAVTQERNGDRDVHKYFKSDKFKNDFSQFKIKFKDLLQKPIEESDHPWNQFQFQELPNKKGMHSFVRFMKTKIKKRRGIRDDLIGEYEEDELYNE